MAGPVNHKTRAHAILSASGAARWLSCTPSARLEDKRGASVDSVFSREGTLAHEFGDLNLRFFNKEISASVLSKELRKLRSHELFSSEMEGEVKKYTDYCEEVYSIGKAKNGDAVMLVEEKFDFSHLVPDGFGTGDDTVISGEVLNIIDLKYGKGVQVDAFENSQLKLYGIGALKGFDMLYDIKTVILTIVQPRLDHVSTWEISAEDLINWGEKEVRETAQKAYEGKGVQKAGDWCKWCKVKGMCATLAAKNVKLARHDFKDPHFLTDEQLLNVYKQIPMLVDWAGSVAVHLLDEAKKGKKWPGLKLVEGKSNRKFSDEVKVKAALEDDLFEPSEYIVSKLAGITAIEKLVGKANFNALLGEYVIKPQGAPTLADENDKRIGIGLAQAKADFED
jgi:hypothetical protein